MSRSGHVLALTSGEAAPSRQHPPAAAAWDRQTVPHRIATRGPAARARGFLRHSIEGSRIVLHSVLSQRIRTAASVQDRGDLLSGGDVVSRAVYVGADGDRRAVRSGTPGPDSWGRAAGRPVHTRSSAAIGPWTCGPSPADHDVSVAVSRNPAILRAEGSSGGGKRMDSTRVAAMAAACGGMSWRRPSGIAMSWAWTRMSISVSRCVTPMEWRAASRPCPGSRR
jgi:hypothetical protein